MSATSEEEKGIIQNLAFETLIWMGVDEDGLINNYVQIDEFKNLREVVLVKRLPDYTGCGCCHEFEGPEEGLAGFREFGEEGDEEEKQWVVEEAEEIAKFMGTAVSVGGNGTEGEVDGEAQSAQQERKRLSMSEECMNVFITIHERDPGWRIPNVREVDLTRDGFLI